MAIVSAMTEVFIEVFTWLTEAIQAVLSVFYTTTENGGELTVLGVLAIIALAISMFFLIVGLSQNFLHLRG